MRTETMTLYRGRKEALASIREGHIEREYDLVSDAVEEDGTRVIRLKPKDLVQLNKMRGEVVDAIAEKLGESRSKTFKAILLDALRDYNKASIKRLYDKIVKGIVPIKATRGCFEIIVGDGRRKRSDIIRIRG